MKSLMPYKLKWSIPWLWCCTYDVVVVVVVVMPNLILIVWLKLMWARVKYGYTNHTCARTGGLVCMHNVSYRISLWLVCAIERSGPPRGSREPSHRTLNSRLTCRKLTGCCPNGVLLSLYWSPLSSICGIFSTHKIVMSQISLMNLPKHLR